MKFCEKLDFMLRLTKTTNSKLSLHITLDASHISRLRSGQRNTPGETVLRSMAEYFSRHCNEEYQCNTLADVLHTGLPLPEEKELAELIFLWLSEGKAGNLKSIETFLNGFSNIRARKEIPGAFKESSEHLYPKQETSVYYGMKGKQQAVVCFLSEVIAQNQPQTLYLFSDENTDWMTEPGFAAQWAVLMRETLARGNRMKVVHTVSRDLDEMLNAIGQWMPLYVSGLIEPYFYSKKRDGLFKRTLFIAPKTCAVVSSAVGILEDQANLVFRNKRTVSAFAEEFMQYLNLCKPLMRIFTKNEQEPLLDILLDFEMETADAVIETASLSVQTMPEELAYSMLCLDGGTDSNVFKRYRQRVTHFNKLIENCEVAEIIQLPDISEIMDKKIGAAFSGMLASPVHYAPEEYMRHLEHIARLLLKYKNYHVCLVNDTKIKKYMIYVKEDVGVFVTGIEAPPIVLAIKDANMTMAFWDYLKSETQAGLVNIMDNQSTAEKLLTLAGEIQSRISAEGSNSPL